MRAVIRVHLDESVDGAIAKALRTRGIDVTTAADAGLLAAIDEEHMRFARSQDRVLVTHDEDYLRLHAAGIEHAGVASCHAEARTIGQMVAGLLLIHGCVSSDEMRGHVEFL